MGPLEGVRVLDLGQYIAGPLCGMLLAEYGADVIKIEPASGDPFRAWDDSDLGATFVAFNRGKRSITLDLKSPRGLSHMLGLVESADVLIQNFSPGVMDRLGLGEKKLHRANPRLITCGISGFGSTGPYAEYPAFDAVAVGYSGLANLLLDPETPQLRGPAIADALTGQAAAMGILAALVQRGITGVGEQLDVTMLGALAHFQTSALTRWIIDGVEEGPISRSRASQAYVFVAGDGRGLILHLSSPPKFWARLCEAIERPDLPSDPRFEDRLKRRDHYEALVAELAPIFASDTRAHWLTVLQEHGVPCAPVNTTEEVLADPQVKHLGLIEVVHDKRFGPLPISRPPVQFGGNPVESARRAPLLGEHTEEVLEEVRRRSRGPEALS